MTRDPRGAARMALEQATRNDFQFFLRRVMGTVSPGVRYLPNWHIEAIGEHLAACARGDVTRLIINLPPRMLKSTLVSVAWPAWLLAHRPQERIMVASYAQSLAIRHSTDCRTVLTAPWYQRAFPATHIAYDQNEKDKFTTTARGYRMAVSVGGAALGEGGNFLIVDDPLNPLQAGHPTQREAVNAWFDHTFSTRLDDKHKGVIVVVMQRLHPQDLSGYLLQKGGWQHLCLPSIAPERSVIRLGNYEHMREAGEALHAERESLALLERTKRELGSSNFNTQYQQSPQQQEGAVIKPAWFAQRGVAAEREMCVQSWDTGIKAGPQHDASACATFVECAGKHHLAEMRTMRMEYPELKRAILAAAERWHPDAILIEDKASGQSLLQDLKRETSLPLIACKSTEDKLSRLVRVTPMMEAGLVVLPAYAPWLASFEQELFAFPAVAHDDQVDAFGQYLNWVRARNSGKNPGIRML